MGLTLQRAALTIGFICLAAGLGIGWSTPKELGANYLIALLFSASIALGALFLVLIHHAARAGWSVSVRRVAENIAGTLPLIALLFIPLLLLAPSLYPWAEHGVHHEGAHAELMAHKAPFLNLPFFTGRVLAYILIWAALGFFFRRLSVKQDSVGGVALSEKMRSLSALGLILFALSTTYGSFDLLMTLEPSWYSTIYGVYFFTGSFLSGLAMVILFTNRLRSMGPLKGVVTAEHDQDLGKYLFGFTVFWAYIAFSQFMLQWYANMPEETAFYKARLNEQWMPWSVLLLVGHFVVPFFFLVSRHIKRRPSLLFAASIWMLLMQLVDLMWLVYPALWPVDPAPIGLLSALCVLGVFGLTLGFAVYLTRRAALVPHNDPRLSESLTFENA